MILAFCGFLSIPDILQAYPFERGPSVEQLGYAVNPTADPISPAARALNPAAGSEITQWAMSASFARSFNLQEFDRFQLAASAPLGSWTVGIWGSGFGHELYSERTAGLNLSYPIYQRLQVGLGISGTQVHVKNYGYDFGSSADLGLHWGWQRLNVGMVIQNVVSSEFVRFAGNGAPRRGELAIRIVATSKLLLFVDAIYEDDHDLGMRVGVEAWLFDPLAVRAGYDSSSDRLHLGLAIKWSGLCGQGAYDHHPWLGWSQAFGMQWYNGASDR